METISENRCFGGVQGVYRHASDACGCDMTFGLYLPPAADAGPVPVVWYLSGLTCTHENAMVKAGRKRGQRIMALRWSSQIPHRGAKASQMMTPMTWAKVQGST